MGLFDSVKNIPFIGIPARLADTALSTITGGNNTNVNTTNPYGVNNLLSQRKDYQIPPELTSAFNLSRATALGEPDIQARLDNVANRQLGQELSTNSRYATSGSEAQLGANRALQDYNANLDQSVIAGTQQKQQNLGNYYSLAGHLANQRQTEFGYNQQYPLEQRLAFLSALQSNTANQNIAQNNANTQLFGSLLGAAALAI